ncbi:MAG: alpha-mannosidase [Candidatus Firestonebacteria bacterium]
MEKHVKLTESRIDKFIQELWSQVYEETVPLKSVFAKSADPVAFSKIKTLKFRKAKKGEPWGLNWDSAWFKFNAVIPSSWKGSEVMAVLDLGGEAAVFSKDGTPLTGLTSLFSKWGMKRRKALYPIKEKASGREKVSLLVEAAANYLFGNQVKCTFKQADLIKFNRKKWELYHDCFFLYDLMLNLPENSGRRAKILFGLNKIINNYYFGRESEVKKCRELAEKLIYNGANASAPLVSAIGHAHIDTAWMWPLRETKRKVGRTFSTAIKMMEEYPDYKFGASQAQLYQFCKENYPKLYEKIKKAVKAKRWEVQGGMWVEADCNLISGESMVRQFLHGKRFFKQEFGVEVDNLWLPDVFGYSAALPQILKKCGVNYFLTQKISWSQFNKFPHHTFNWEGLDGTRVFTHFPPADSYNSVYEPQELLKAQNAFLEKDRANRWIYLFGFGDGGGGPSRHELEFSKRVKNCEELPKVTQEFAKDFFPKCEKDIKDPLTWKGELYLEFHRGTYTTQARNKKYNRKSELLLRDAELLSSLNLKNYPAKELDRLWKLVLLNQFHDIIPGSSIPWVYKDSLKQYEDITKSGEEIVVSGLRTLCEKIDTKGFGKPVVIFNSLSWTRSGLVLLPKIKGGFKDNLEGTVVTQETKDGLLARVDVSPLGYAVYFSDNTIEKNKTASDLKVNKNLLENSLLRVKFSKDGQVFSIQDKETGRESVKTGGFANVFKIFDEKGEDAWDTHIYHEEQKYASPKLVKSEVIEEGPLRASIRQTWKVSESSSIIQEIRLESRSKKVEFFTKLEWTEREKLLKVYFDTSINSLKAKYEIQYGHVERPAHRNTSWDMAKFEVCAHKWMDYSEEGYGISLLNDGKYGQGIKDGTMSLTLLRSPKPPDPALIHGIKPASEDDTVTDQGLHEFTYVLYPHTGSIIEAKTVQAGYELNTPLRTALLGKGSKGKLGRAHSFYSVDNESVIIEAVKKSEEGNDIIIRMYEAYGKSGKAVLTVANELDIKKVELVNMLEEKQGALKIEDRKIKFKVRPFDIITLRLVIGKNF